MPPTGISPPPPPPIHIPPCVGLTALGGSVRPLLRGGGGGFEGGADIGQEALKRPVGPIPDTVFARQLSDLEPILDLHRPAGCGGLHGADKGRCVSAIFLQVADRQAAAIAGFIQPLQH